MPKRKDLHKILIIGAGPIIISQACEFDYSGTQACKALKEEGYEVILINSNPATIMTDPQMADKTYIEPIVADIVAKIIERERPDAILPTLGGQTGLNTAIEVHKTGILEKYKVEMIGASIESIKKAEDRDLFRQAMEKIGLRVPKSGIARDLQTAKQIASQIGYPIIVRPSFTLGGTGGGIAYNSDDLEQIAKSGLDASLIGQVMLEESVLGWKEFELEVVRDKKDNVVIICSIENIDPMGVHTGDSITVAPAQTLTDKEYQKMRNAAISIMREIGVDTGGSNVQFAINPKNGEMVVIEMNPRVSRSSALASKATGYPIAKIAAKLAVGYTLDEIPNDITGETFASFEPSIDYCVVKIPRWAFEKFPETQDYLTTAMKSVGETMSIGRTFKEAFQKALRSLEIGRFGFGADGKDKDIISLEQKDIEQKLVTPNSQRIFYIRYALIKGLSIDYIYELTNIDTWFLEQFKQIINCEQEILDFKQNIENKNLEEDKEFIKLLEKAKIFGFSDKQIAYLMGTDEDKINLIRQKAQIKPVYKLVDTCAAEFKAVTPYYYSTYEQENESKISNCKKVMILGGGPNRIGQGIEFDYCCVHASFALREEGVESIMVNSNPETVSTDYDISDKLYFEPLTKEDVLHIINLEKPFGVIVQFGGQTPLNLTKDLALAGVSILGTQSESIDIAEDRKLFQEMLKKLNLRQPENGTAIDTKQAKIVAQQIGYPVIVRPSYVLGGRAMKIVYNEPELEDFTKLAIQASPDHPILIDKFLENALEIDVDAISDGKETIIAGIMEHIEEAGIHSGDSACVLPPISIDKKSLNEIIIATKAMSKELKVIGLMNVQYAIKDNKVFVLEVNPRASRTIPFVSKATGIPFAKLAVKAMLGKSLKDLGLEKEFVPKYLSVKEAVLPFDRFSGTDTLLGPEMKSTGEVMGIDFDFGMAYAKAQIAAGQKLPGFANLTMLEKKEKNIVFMSVDSRNKPALINIALEFHKMGFAIMATRGTAEFLKSYNIPAKTVNKVSVGRPHVVDAIKNKEINLIINTNLGNDKDVLKDGFAIRRSAIKFGIPYTTTIAGALAMCNAVKALMTSNLSVKTIQEYHKL